MIRHGTARIALHPLSTGPNARKSRRLERRYEFRLPLIVIGLSTSGVLFREVVFTQDISVRGCRIRLHTQPDAVAGLTLRPLPREEGAWDAAHIMYEVAWMRRSGTEWELGCYVLSGRGILDLAFPCDRPQVANAPSRDGKE